MSQAAVEQLLGRLITDRRFRERAMLSLERVCIEEGYELSSAERNILAAMNLGKIGYIEDEWLDSRVRRYCADYPETQGI